MSEKIQYEAGMMVKLFLREGDPLPRAAMIGKVLGGTDDRVDLVIYCSEEQKTKKFRDVPYNSNDDPDGVFWRFSEYDSRPDTFEHIAAVQDLMNRMIFLLACRSEAHDQSKLVSPEVELFDEYTPKLKGTTYGSDEYKSYLEAMKPGLEHHYAANSHHPEHYRWRCGVCERRCTEAEWEVAPQGPNDSGQRYCPDCCRHGMLYEAWLKDETDKGLHGMTLLDLVEMLCDWKAATARHADGDIRRSIEVNQKRFGYSDELKAILYNTLAEIESDGPRPLAKFS